ncbi:MAG: VWA domain-containing protein [Deltaproteobacteria bacterium]|nr:VWA domain-containing protein [Nannocystaceae bacterium]
MQRARRIHGDEAGRLILAIVITGAVALACAVKGDADDGSATGPGETGSGDPATGESSGRPGEATGAPGDTGDPDDDDGTTAAASSGSEGPQQYFDVGALPDLPGIDPRCEQNLDIVFVIDVSTTMGEFIGLLSEEMLAVDAAVQELDLLSAPHYGLAVFVDDAALLNDGQPYDDALALQDDFEYWADFTSSNEQVGGGNGNSTWTENSLDGLYFAAEQFDWRPAGQTTRIIVHVTDDTFWDGPTVGNGVAILHGYEETVDELQDETVRVFSFADTIGGSCECEDVSPGWSTPYMDMTPIPEATDGGVFDINMILAGTVSLTEAIDAAVEESYCNPYVPTG